MWLWCGYLLISELDCGNELYLLDPFGISQRGDGNGCWLMGVGCGIIVGVDLKGVGVGMGYGKWWIVVFDWVSRDLVWTANGAGKEMKGGNIDWQSTNGCVIHNWCENSLNGFFSFCSFPSRTLCNGTMNSYHSYHNDLRVYTHTAVNNNATGKHSCHSIRIVNQHQNPHPTATLPNPPSQPSHPTPFNRP